MIQIKLGSTQEAKKPEEAVHDSPINIGGELVAIKVSNAMLHPLPKFGSGKDRGTPQSSRAGAPPGL